MALEFQGTRFFLPMNLNSSQIRLQFPMGLAGHVATLFGPKKAVLRSAGPGPYLGPRPAPPAVRLRRAPLSRGLRQHLHTRGMYFR